MLTGHLKPLIPALVVTAAIAGQAAQGYAQEAENSAPAATQPSGQQLKPIGGTKILTDAEKAKLAKQQQEMLKKQCAEAENAETKPCKQLAQAEVTE